MTLRRTVLNTLTSVVVTTTSVVAVSQSPDSLNREASYLQDLRLSGDGRLANLLRDPSPRVRKAAAIAAANIQDSTLLPVVVPLLSDPQVEVRRAAAFALGQIGTRASSEHLLNVLRNERDQAVLKAVIDALGKAGGQHELDLLVAAAESPGFRARPEDIATGIARFGIRGIRGERAIWWCFASLQHRFGEVRWRALYGLWRMAPHALIEAECARQKDLLLNLTHDPVADVRFNLAVLLGRIESQDARDVLVSLERMEARSRKRDWRVDVNTARALAVHGRKDNEAAQAFLRILWRNDDHTLSAACQALHNGPRLVGIESFQESLQVRLRSLIQDERRPESIRGDAAIAYVRVSPGHAGYILEMLRTRGTDDRLAPKLLDALSQAPGIAGFQETKALLASRNVQLSMAAWDYLRRYVRTPALDTIAAGIDERSALGRDLFTTLCIALRRDDMGITTVVSTLASDSSFVALIEAGGVKAGLVDSLCAAVDRLRSPMDVEAQQAAIQALASLGDARAIPVLERALNDADRTVGQAAAAALKSLTRTDYSSRVPPASKAVYTDFDWKTLTSLGGRPRAIMHTSKGEITVELLPEDAPFTVLSFLRLARKKFYDGLTFHRVVPNFVVQGGDPRGDSWGGPGYSIRSEVSLVGYERGSVGMASAGKDTEGSQFFITHAPTLHLDGRYTIFGKVVRGMDVVDRLQIGDRILSVTLQRDRAR